MAIAFGINISTVSENEFKTGFYKLYPKPSEITDSQHIKNITIGLLATVYKDGRHVIANETTVPEVEIT